MQEKERQQDRATIAMILFVLIIICINFNSEIKRSKIMEASFTHTLDSMSSQLWNCEQDRQILMDRLEIPEADSTKIKIMLGGYGKQ